MTAIATETLYDLLPAQIRIRDAEEGGPLRALMALMAREAAVVEEGIAQLLDDQFIETCAPWAVPYIGALLGVRPLLAVEDAAFSPRADVANTIARRRRKGTPAALESLARDATGWPARAVEYGPLTATCQHVNVARPDHAFAPDLRDPLALEALGTAFDAVARGVDVRDIAAGRDGLRGRHNFPHVGLHLWRLAAQRLSDVPSVRVDGRRRVLDPLGGPCQIVNRPRPEDGIGALATALNVPGAISRRALHASMVDHYGRDAAGAILSVEITVDGVPVPATRIVACDLSDDGAGWAHSPHPAMAAADLAAIEGGPPLSPPANARVRVDPVLGRVAFPEEEAGIVRATFHVARAARIGGGEYDRAGPLARPTADRPLLRLPDPTWPTLQAALDALPLTGGIVEIASNDTIDETPALALAAGAAVELRAADGARPVLQLGGDLVVAGGAEARLVIDGLVISGGALRVDPDAGGAGMGSVTLRHVTLVPGRGLDAAGGPTGPGAPSLVVAAPGVEVTLERCITGPVRLHDAAALVVRDGIVDAAAARAIDSPEGLAIAGLADEAAGSVTIVAATIVGRVRARALPLVSDSILHARPDPAAPGEPAVQSLRRQEGCLRFSYVPEGSVVPRRHRCQPSLAIERAVAEREAELGAPLDAAGRALVAARVARGLVPSFTDLRYGAPAYGQLRASVPPAIREGASDEGEMGALHHLHEPRRRANLALRLEEHLRAGLRAGAINET